MDRLQPSTDPPPIASGIPDLTKGEGPSPEEAKGDWFLHCGGARGWAHRDENGKCDQARQILVTKVPAGSPVRHELKVGDVILGVNGKLFERDARRSFAEAVMRAEAEAGQGKLNVHRWCDGDTEDVVIQLPVLGSYSKTTPWNCPKSEKILEGACRYFVEKDILRRPESRSPERALAALALMSTGKAENMNLARGYVYDLLERVAARGEFPPHWGYAAWGWAYHNLVLCEYFLLTGDEAALPAIRKFSQRIAVGQSGVGSWGHRMSWPDHGRLHGYGAMNQSGTICWISMLAAKRCGVTSDEIEKAIDRGHTYLSMFVDNHTVPYGDNIQLNPNHHDDNGKTSAAACGFSMLGDEHGADFFGRMTVASWSARELGHTGVWWSLLWGPLGAQRSGRAACSAFLLEMAWLHDLERRWDGGFTYQGKMGRGNGVDEKTGRQRGTAEHQYGHWDTTACRILMYTLPDKRLLIQGKDTLVTPIPHKEVPAVIEAGRPPAKGLKSMAKRYDSESTGELLASLGSWSPIVRRHAALSLAKKDGSHTESLVKMLQRDDLYAQYGACTALRLQKSPATAAVEPLIALLDEEDRMLKGQTDHGLPDPIRGRRERHPPGNGNLPGVPEGRPSAHGREPTQSDSFFPQADTHRGEGHRNHPGS